MQWVFHDTFNIGNIVMELNFKKLENCYSCITRVGHLVTFHAIQETQFQ